MIVAHFVLARGYDVVADRSWCGQTLGKRVMRLRVVGRARAPSRPERGKGAGVLPFTATSLPERAEGMEPMRAGGAASFDIRRNQSQL
jgi:hypothetical protein